MLKTLATATDGHIEDTALPGVSGNIGIAGHRDTTFRPLRHLKVGERLVLTTAERVFDYRISGTKIVTPEDVHVLDPTPRPTLTLVTCLPLHVHWTRAEAVHRAGSVDRGAETLALQGAAGHPGCSSSAI